MHSMMSQSWGECAFRFQTRVLTAASCPLIDNSLSGSTALYVLSRLSSSTVWFFVKSVVDRFVCFNVMGPRMISWSTTGSHGS